MNPALDYPWLARNAVAMRLDDVITRIALEQWAAACIAHFVYSTNPGAPKGHDVTIEILTPRQLAVIKPRGTPLTHGLVVRGNIDEVYVRAFLAENPAMASGILRAVADGLLEYEAAQRSARSAYGRDAIRRYMGMYRTIPKADRNVAALIDIAFAQFPVGVAGHAIVETDFWEQFLLIAQAEAESSSDEQRARDREWLVSVRGPETTRWWDTVVQPALTCRFGARS